MSVFKSEMGRDIVHQKYREILNDWPLDNNQYTVDTGFGKTFVIESGHKNNPPLLLIHGSVSNSYCWIGDVEKLSGHYNVYAIDIIGEAGFSDETRPSYQSGAYEKWLLEVIKGLNLEKVSIVGLSLGGWMALNFAIHYPSLVDKLILLCPGGLYPERKSFLPKVIFYSLMGRWGSRQITKMINGGLLPEVIDDGMKEALEYTTLIGKHFKPRMDPLVIFTEDQIKRLTMPVLAIYGDKDCIMNGKKSIENLLEHGQKSRGILLKNIGHVLAGQTQTIIDFIEGKPSNML